MKNITLSADEHLIEQARENTRRRNSTLNALFREWLADLAQQQERAAQLDALMARLDYVDARGSFSRDEMNER
jgi:dsDNA-specific endonuclease/ATPase MutS2